jgi:hypothetical protein
VVSIEKNLFRDLVRPIRIQKASSSLMKVRRRWQIEIIPLEYTTVLLLFYE